MQMSVETNAGSDILPTPNNYYFTCIQYSLIKVRENTYKLFYNLHSTAADSEEESAQGR